MITLLIFILSTFAKCHVESENKTYFISYAHTNGLKSLELTIRIEAKAANAPTLNTPMRVGESESILKTEKVVFASKAQIFATIHFLNNSIHLRFNR